ncbi:MAG: hypothetical protein IAG13_07810 [Deltaproteobacteria bacterium]|nr:hypothetical protein [Nannocystaceae bacterium]
MRFGFAALFLGLALLIPDLTTRMVFAVTGVVALLFIGPIMDNRLDAIGRSIAAADRRTASRLLVGLDNLRVVKLFASHGWVALQRGRLNLAPVAEHEVEPATGAPPRSRSPTARACSGSPSCPRWSAPKPTA